MRPWKFHEITSADQRMYNPVNLDGFDELIGLLHLPENARVLDIACGGGGPLTRIGEVWDIQGIGVDLCPAFLARAEEAARLTTSGSSFQFVESDGAAFRDEPESYDLAMCLGGSWVFGGHHGTLRALAEFVRPGGLVMVGEPYWRQEPPAEYQEASGEKAEAYGTHFSNVQDGIAEGLSLLYTVVSRKQDWDRYEGSRWQAAERYAVANPDDPDLPELLERARQGRDAYLRWGRDVLGWAVYLFMKPARS